jgi:small subunit ribosomal protein S3
MIERKFVSENIKEFMVKEYVNDSLKRAGQSDIKMKKTPLGEKIVIRASKPGLIVGRKGENIKLLTSNLKRQFELENPQIEIEEVEDINLDPRIVAERIAITMERFGSGRFKSIGHKALEDIKRSGALGAEIVVSGKIPSARAKRWRFNMGYIKKSGQVSKEGVLKAYTTANLKSGSVGVQVKIMRSDVYLPDAIKIRSGEEVKNSVAPAPVVDIPKTAEKKGGAEKKKRRAPRKKSKPEVKEEVKADEKKVDGVKSKNVEVKP